MTTSSPRSWGCFHITYGVHKRVQVFPTLVGVFPITTTIMRHYYGLPHARGGVS